MNKAVYIKHVIIIGLIFLGRYVLTENIGTFSLVLPGLLVKGLIIVYSLTAFLLAIFSILLKLSRLDNFSYTAFYSDPMNRLEKLLLFYGVAMLIFQSIL